MPGNASIEKVVVLGDNRILGLIDPPTIECRVNFASCIDSPENPTLRIPRSSVTSLNQSRSANDSEPLTIILDLIKEADFISPLGSDSHLFDKLSFGLIVIR